MLSLEAILPLAAIRAHTKTDDVMTVTDDQLEMYRAAAFEAAEAYTGQSWTGPEQVEQQVAAARGNRNGRVTIRLARPATHGVIVFDGGGRNVRTVHVPRNATRVDLPVIYDALDACCSPCGGANYGIVARYTSGIECPSKVPPGIKLGCLKFIAWCIGNPGDALVTLGDGFSRTGGLMAGTNNGAWGSGAIDQWRQYRQDIAA
jgi:hypothetical protein